MGRIRKDALDLEFLPETSYVKFIGPKRIGCFSIIASRDKECKELCFPDNAAQKYLVSTELNEPLNCLEDFNPETDKCLLAESWPDFLRWIRTKNEIIRGLTSPDDSSSSIDFVCSNAALKNIMLSLYSKSDWIINAIKIGKAIVIFVSDEDASKKRDLQPENNSHKNKLSYSRFKVIKKIAKQVEERELNSTTELDSLSTVSLSQIGQHHILHSGFTDFVMSKDDVNKPIEEAKFGALKLVHNLFKGRIGDLRISFYREMYWWASALLCGVETFVCGDLDGEFTLRKLEMLPVSILNKRNNLKAQRKCFITLDKVLLYIKSQVQESNKFYEISFKSEDKEVTASLSTSPTEDYISSILFAQNDSKVEANQSINRSQS